MRFLGWYFLAALALGASEMMLWCLMTEELTVQREYRFLMLVFIFDIVVACPVFSVLMLLTQIRQPTRMRTALLLLSAATMGFGLVTALRALDGSLSYSVLDTIGIGCILVSVGSFWLTVKKSRTKETLVSAH